MCMYVKHFKHFDSVHPVCSEHQRGKWCGYCTLALVSLETFWCTVGFPEEFAVVDVNS